MSLIPQENTQANTVFQVGFWTMGLGGTLALGWTLPALQNNAPHALAPLLLVEGAGLSLIGISQLMSLRASRTQDKLRASGLTLLGMGIGALGVADTMTSDRMIILTASALLLVGGGISVGLADDTAKLVKWKD